MVKKSLNGFCLIYTILIFAVLLLSGEFALNLVRMNQENKFAENIRSIAMQQAQLIEYKFDHTVTAFETVEIALDLTKYETSVIKDWMIGIFNLNPFVSEVGLFIDNEDKQIFFRSENLTGYDILPDILDSLAVSVTDTEFTGLSSDPGSNIEYFAAAKKIFGGAMANSAGYWGGIAMIMPLSVITDDIDMSIYDLNDYEYRVVYINRNDTARHVIFATTEDQIDWTTYHSIDSLSGRWMFQAFDYRFIGNRYLVYHIFIVFLASVSALVFNLNYRKVIFRSSHTDDLNKELSRLLTTDYLTSVKNRRGIYDFMDTFIPFAKRNDIPVSLAMLDLDGFKDINDLMGHEGGDKALLFFAEIYQDKVRASDILGRFGGDEFICIFTDCDIDGAAKVGLKLLEELRKKPFEFKGNKAWLSFSMGITQLKDEDTDVETLIARADKALYKAKRSGKTRIVLDDKNEVR